MTMPVRVQSWNTRFGLAPVFEMNLPEGAFAKGLYGALPRQRAGSTISIFSSVVGRTQIGRLRYSALDVELDEEVPFQSIDEILRARRGGELFDYLLETFAAHSGLSGVQPKVMIRAKQGGAKRKTSGRESSSLRSATHIVKLWDAANIRTRRQRILLPHCCAQGRPYCARLPAFRGRRGAYPRPLRFDDGAYLGFEDFCVLNGLQTADKYSGSYEIRLFKRLADYAGPETYADPRAICSGCSRLIARSADRKLAGIWFFILGASACGISLIGA